MQLSKIKIAGFKSFVDPTTIGLPGKLVAIVGPNGCGKSNIIDAVTWVMGESSPKYLRGEALTDVIFNGSSARKPVGQASVELIFDNQDGSIGGEYANFSEISVKRVINRDSESTYYLNGVRCRKKDVTTLFLGTGLGPRSYSIIGQNMITRIIEAKPEELRAYLEEAAGISKYKERRHETELRINHTKENLLRVNDLRSELEKQLSHLKHQANVAEKFKVLKEQERVIRAELFAMEWRQLDANIVEYTLNIQREETALEARQTELISIDKEIEHLRHEQRVANDGYQEVQRKYYSVGNEITRIEQDIMHHQQRKDEWEKDLKNTDDHLQSIKKEIEDAEDELGESEKEFQHLEPKYAHAKKELKVLNEAYECAEERTQKWQSEWDEFNQINANILQVSQVGKTHIEHVEKRIEFLQKQEKQFIEEQHKCHSDELEKELTYIDAKSLEVKNKLDLQQTELNKIRDEISSFQAIQHESTNQLDKVRNELQVLHGQRASLEALQQTVLGKRDNPVLPWLRSHKFENNQRLAQVIEVEKGWELAVEKALGYYLQAVCADDLQTFIEKLNDFKTGNLIIFQKSNPVKKPTLKKPDLLINKIKSIWSLDSILSGIYVANSLEEAQKICATLNQTESVITPTGEWFNPNWVKIMKEEDPTIGIFQREQDLKGLNTQINYLQLTKNELEKNIEDRKQDIKKMEEVRDALQTSNADFHAQSVQFTAQRKMKEEKTIELKTRSEKLAKEIENCKKQLNEAQKDLLVKKEEWQNSINELESHQSKREKLMHDREEAKNHLLKIRDELNQKRENLHELELRLQTSSSHKNALSHQINRSNAQLTSVIERKTNLQSELMSMQPIDTLKKSLARVLDKHISVEAELNSTRIAVESLEQEYRNLENKRSLIEKEINKIRNVLESLRVDWQGWKVKADSIQEQIKETQYKLEDVLKNLSTDGIISDWKAKLDQLLLRINRLGAINLVAIEEYATCLERKKYFDKQVEDLHTGLQTLEEAIAKIDRETKIRFKETFNNVNARFQSLFPMIFGGGKAYLELTSDDLLVAGVTTMACPPGKRNSSIYLLSGGEKSLTAIALIFSIFDLNPAPFCLLDEVDAALDDANVLRFTRLVKTMVEKTQFIFISHNKITIEMAENLIGVTMNEPGVSRLVSVDIDKAMQMAKEAI